MGRRHHLAAEHAVDDPAVIADSLVALHSTDPATVYLSVAARMAAPAITPTSLALYDDRSLVRHHGMRRTIWVYTPAVARMVHAACTADIALAEWKQLAKWVARSGVPDPDAWMQRARAHTLAELHRLGPCSARQLGKAVPELTTKIEVGTGRFTAQQPMHTRMLSNLGFDAAIVRTAPTGSWVSSEYQWSVMADWLPEGIVGLDTAAAREELVASYLRSFGPATAADVQWWTGWTMGVTRAAIAANDVLEVGLDDDLIGWVLAEDGLSTEADGPWVALLPALDPTAMGWKHREWYLSEWAALGGPLFDRSGNVGPTVWVNGEVVGGWAQRADGALVHELLRPVDPSTKRAIAVEAERLREVIGDARVTPRFPTPLQRQLAAG